MVSKPYLIVSDKTPKHGDAIEIGQTLDEWTIDYIQHNDTHSYIGFSRDVGDRQSESIIWRTTLPASIEAARERLKGPIDVFRGQGRWVNSK